ncbi:MAG: tyrosine-type recombinase/integrase [Aquificae bacterium]|nr:tyrosine-type recombinase/integrase [Aquificota bacterium]
MNPLKAWERHLEKTKSEKTKETYSMLVREFLEFHEIGEGEVIESLKPSLIYRFIDEAHLNPSSLLTTLSALRYFLKFLLRREYLDRTLYESLESAIEEAREELNARKTPRYPRALTREEIEKIFEKVRGKKYEKIYSLFLYSGIRLGEYEKLKRENFYLDKSGILWIKLTPEMTKRNKGRLVPVLAPDREETLKITEKFMNWLENFEENFRVKRGVLQVYTDRLSKRLNIDFSIHSFRHTYITNLINSGFPVEVVKEFAGHSSVKTTIETYYRFSQKRAEELVRSYVFS